MFGIFGSKEIKVVAEIVAPAVEKSFLGKALSNGLSMIPFFHLNQVEINNNPAPEIGAARAQREATMEMAKSMMVSTVSMEEEEARRIMLRATELFEKVGEEQKALKKRQVSQHAWATVGHGFKAVSKAAGIVLAGAAICFAKALVE